MDSGRITRQSHVQSGEVSHTTSEGEVSFRGREVAVGESEGARVPRHEGGVEHVSMTRRDVAVEEQRGCGLSTFESLPPELRLRIAAEMDPQSLLALSQTSRTMNETAIQEGKIRLLGPACDGDGGLASSERVEDRMKAVQTATGMLACSRLSHGDRGVLLNVLVGVDGKGGLANDADPQVRKACIKAIGSLLIQGVPGARDKLVGALIGGPHGLGLIHDDDPGVAGYAAGLLGNLLQYDELGEGFKHSLLTPILGEGRRKGMLHSRDPQIQAGALKVVGNLMFKGALEPAVRKQLLIAILGDGSRKGFIGSSNADVRKAAFDCLGSLMRSSSVDKRFKAWVCDVLVGQNGMKGGLVRDKNPDVRQAANQLVQALSRRDSGVGQMERISIANYLFNTRDGVER